VALNEDELKAIENLDCSLHEKMQKIKDVFLIEIYTGFRISDLYNLKIETIDYKNEVIKIRDRKTRGIIDIPLTKKLKIIIEKYIDTGLPLISEQKYNEAIKELCRLAGIDTMINITKFYLGSREDEVKPKYELISSHTARRTFITLSLKWGVPHKLIMKITGHKSLRAFEKYIRFTEKEAQDAIKNVWDRD
jgi:integrase